MKRAKSARDDTRGLVARGPAQPIRSLRVEEEVKGCDTLTPLCISHDGSRAWARERPEPHRLFFIDLGTINAAWEPTAVASSPGPWGFTRCDAVGTFFAMQRRQDGLWVVTDGAGAHATSHLSFNMDQTQVIRTDDAPDGTTEAPAARAVACIPEVGICAIIDDLGLIFFPMFVDQPPSVCYCSDKLESTVSVQGTMAFITEGSDVLMVDLKNGVLARKMSIPNMGTDERVWNLSVSGPLMALCTMFNSLDIKSDCHPKVMWLAEADGTPAWTACNITGIVAVAADCETGLIAILTALGDLIITDSLKRVPPKRFEEGTEGVPFLSQHTRDAIIAWGPGALVKKCIRLIKPGGAIYRVHI